MGGGLGGTLLAATIVGKAGHTGRVARYDPADKTYLVDFESGGHRWVRRGCFDVAIGWGGSFDLIPLPI